MGIDKFSHIVPRLVGREMLRDARAQAGTGSWVFTYVTMIWNEKSH